MERKYPDNDISVLGQIICSVVVIGTFFVMKKISDSVGERRGEQKETWKEWLFR